MIEQPEHKLYKRRWVIMFLFMVYAINGGAQWLQFSIIGNLVIKYYNGITLKDVEWTNTCSMLAYVILVFPSLYFLDKMGVRSMMVTGAAGMAIGTWIKVFTVHPDRFYLALGAQCFQALFQILTFSLSARFTALWFGADEISIAGALGLFGDQLGSALGFLIPPILVKDGSSEIIGNGLQKMHWYYAGISTITFLLIAFLFKSKPKLPPSAAQAKQRESKKENLLRAIKTIMKKRSFIFILLSYSLNLGSMGAMITHLNETVLSNFPLQTEDAGNIGFVLMLSGMFSSLAIGKIIDKTRKFKESAVLLTTGSALAFTGYTLALKSHNIIYVYIAAFFLGSFAQSYYATGFQMAIEVTFPVSEEISSAILFLSVQCHAFTITILHGYAINLFGDLLSNIGLIVTFSISVLCAILVPSNLRRQAVEKSAQDKIREKEMIDLISSKNGTIN